MHLTYQNVNDAFKGLVEIFHTGRDYSQSEAMPYKSIPLEVKASRVGEVAVIEEPIIITYRKPCERVLLNKARDANPFFHLYEALHMLAGRRDIAPLNYYSSNYAKQVQDPCPDPVIPGILNPNANGAYGYRWRHAYDGDTFDGDGIDGTDQLKVLIAHLKAKPESRRAVLNMWNVQNDLLKIDSSKDVCCNLNVCFWIEHGRCTFCSGDRNSYCPKCDNEPHDQPRYLNMTVFNRSNDLCLAGETKFRSPEGDASIETLAKRFQTRKGYKFPIYAVDTATGDQRLCWMSNAWKSGTKPVYKIGFDDGSFIRLTGDHKLFRKVKLQDGKRCVGIKIVETQACDLRVGHRVLADLPENSSSRQFLGKYLKFKKNLFSNTGYSNMEEEHRAYYEFITGEDIGEDDVHHKNENGRDNRFSNLERLSRSEHRSYHLKKDNPNNKMTPAQVFERASKGGKTAKGRKYNDAIRAKMSRAATLRDSQGKRKKDHLGRYASNHKVTSIERDGLAVVYDFTVPSRHNAILSNGVLAHNCWGALGANYVHFSFLQEYVAAHLGLEVGVYNQVSNNLHVYTERFEPEKWLASDQFWVIPDPKEGQEEYGIRYWEFYTYRTPPLTPFIKDPATFDTELPHFVKEHEGEALLLSDWKEPFLDKVAKPMLEAFRLHKLKNYDASQYWLDKIESADWKIASENWINKRRQKVKEVQV